MASTWTLPTGCTERTTRAKKKLSKSCTCAKRCLLEVAPRPDLAKSFLLKFVPVPSVQKVFYCSCLHTYWSRGHVPKVAPVLCQPCQKLFVMICWNLELGPLKFEKSWFTDWKFKALSQLQKHVGCIKRIVWWKLNLDSESYSAESLKVESWMNCGDRLGSPVSAAAAWQARSAAVSALPSNTNTQIQKIQIQIQIGSPLSAAAAWHGKLDDKPHLQLFLRCPPNYKYKNIKANTNAATKIHSWLN